MSVRGQFQRLTSGNATGFNRTLNQFKQGFFDRKVVTQRADKMRVRGLARFGAMVRTVARRSMRRRQKPSEPGTPPSAVQGHLRDFLFFAYDAAGANGNGSVVVGPAGFKRSVVPALHEFGGDVAGNGRVVWMTRKPGRDSKGRFVTAGKERVTLNGNIRYPARPYMRPALEKIKPKFAGLFRDSL